MLIGLVGPVSSGKKSIGQYLVSQHCFTELVVELKEERHERADSSVSLSDSLGHLALSSTVNTSNAPNAPNTPNQTTKVFSNSADLLNFVTSNWTTDFVVPDLFHLYSNDPSFCLQEWTKRPFFLLVAVTAPVLTRYSRHLTLTTLPSTQPTTLESFLTHDDTILYTPKTPSHIPLFKIMHKASLTITNTLPSLPSLHTHLSSPTLALLSPSRLRPSWDRYFMSLCDLAAHRSNCMKRRVGCVVTKERRVIATGYNGTPKGLRNCNEGGCARCNGGVAKCGEALETCICLHAEENALLEAGRERISSGGRAILYCNTCPCIQCARKIIQVGISEVVYSLSYGMDDTTKRLFLEAGVELRQLDALEDCV